MQGLQGGRAFSSSSYSQRIFRRLHSQQLVVPFRSFLRFALGGASIVSVLSSVDPWVGVGDVADGGELRTATLMRHGGG